MTPHVEPQPEASLPTDLASLRVSDFSTFISIPSAQFTLAVNTLHGKCIDVPEDVSDSLQAGELQTLPASLISRLIDQCIVTTHSSEAEWILLQQLLLDPSQAEAACPRIYLMPSYECNLKCVYCFQHRVRKREPSIRMTEDIARRAIGFAARAFERRGVRGLTLYGGEPLLPDNERLIRFICEEAGRCGLAVMAATHAFNLDLYRESLGPQGISKLHITVDGLSSTHDRLRVGPRGAPTFFTIMSNIKSALRAEAHVRLRVNVDRSVLEQLDDFRIYLETEGFLGNPLFSAYVAPIFVTRAQYEAKKDTVSRRTAHADLANALGNSPALAQAFEGLPPLYARITALLGEHQRGSGAGYCCGGVPTVVLDPRGDVYPCVFLAGTREYAVGNYLRDGDKALDELDRWIARGAARCTRKRCKYALYCGGGSPYDAFASGGTSDMPSCRCDDFESTFVGYVRAACSRVFSL
jgi:uncharacterized protein